MYASLRKEQFSFAYVNAIVTAAGCNTGYWTVDEDSVDMSVRATGINGKVRRSPQLDLQLKCTAQPPLSQGKIHFELKRKNYEELLPERFTIPKILIVVIVPEDFQQWVDQTEESLALRHCGYWYSLKNHAHTENKATVTLRIPRNKIFSAQALIDMMQIAAEGRHP